MTLRLEKTVKVPERTLYKSIGGHFVKTHLDQNLSELSAYFK